MPSNQYQIKHLTQITNQYQTTKVTKFIQA